MALPPYRVDYSPIIERPRLEWPDGARVALWIAPNIEHYEYLPDFDGLRNPWPRTPYPDAQQYSYRDYGNRVGFWRMADVLDRYGIRCCVSLNMAVLEHFPEIGEAMGSGRLAGVPAGWCREMATKDYNHGLVLQKFPVPGEADFDPRENRPATHWFTSTATGSPAYYVHHRRFGGGTSPRRSEPSPGSMPRSGSLRNRPGCAHREAGRSNAVYLAGDIRRPASSQGGAGNGIWEANSFRNSRHNSKHKYDANV